MSKLLEHRINIKKIKFPDGKYYCKKWYESFESLVMKDYTAPLIAAAINLISSQIFILLAKNERQHSTAVENESIFYLTFFQSFITNGLVLVFTGDHQSWSQLLNTEWYIKTGSAICLTMIIETFSTKFIDISRILYALILRLRDRNYTTNIKKYEELGVSSDMPNTRQFRQKELNDIYTGP